MTTMPLTPTLLLWAYSKGLFPMARSRTGTIDWYSPDPRAVIPLESVHFSHSLRKAVRQGKYRITFDEAFEHVIRQCALPRSDNSQTWINEEIIEAYCELHQMRYAHSVEAWLDEPHIEHEQAGEENTGQLIGGLYGVSLGGAFFGESMFSVQTNASKICFVHLIHHLNEKQYQLLDTQFANPHMEQFGIELVPRERYLQRLHEAIHCGAHW